MTTNVISFNSWCVCVCVCFLDLAGRHTEIMDLFFRFKLSENERNQSSMALLFTPNNNLGLLDPYNIVRLK